MPSFRSICLIAATAFAAFASASPVAGGASLVEARDVLSGVAHSVNARAVDSAVVELNARDIVGEPILEARADPKSLPVVLRGAQTALIAVKAKVDIIAKGNNVPVETVKPCLDEIHGIFVGVLVDVKLLIGKPVGVIGVIGILAVIDLAVLICAILTLVVNILTALIGCVGINAHLVIDIVVATISVVLCEVLTVVLGLVGGLLAIVVSLLGGLLASLSGCGLAAVLVVLKL